MVTRNKEKLKCIEFLELKETVLIETMLFNNPEDIIYVLDNGKLMGVITLGDLKRSYPEVIVNTKFKKLLDTVHIKADADNIILNNPRIKNIPVVDKNGLLLYEISFSNSVKKLENTEFFNYIDDMVWFNYYISYRECSNICIIDYNSFGEMLKNKINNDLIYKVDIITIDKFSELLFDNYDLLVDCDILQYRRRKELLYCINKELSDKYVSVEEMNFFVEAFNFYNRIKKLGVKFYVFEAPCGDKLKYISDKQKDRMASGQNWKYYYKNASQYNDEMQEIFGTKQYQPIIDNIFNLPVAIRKGKVLCYEEFRSQFCNIAGGYRITCNKKWGNYIQELNIFGSCAVFGLFVEDKNTISSFLQNLLNNSPLCAFNVNNFGIRGADTREIIQCIKSKKYEEGDIVILYLTEEEAALFKLLDKDLPVIKLSELFNMEHKKIGTFFIDRPVHHNYKANHLVASKIFHTLLDDYRKGEIKIFIDKKKENNKNLINDLFASNSGLHNYINKLSLDFNKYKKGNNGAVVMNCNPFTKGHRYLIEQSAKQVDTLFVFVVEEDKSFFKFEDRINLVKKGTEDIKNVIVLPSGNFMISSITFPEYFQKEDKQEVVIDASLDIEVFAQYIAPSLGITVRFAGEEPFDMVTKQYNELMKRVLPDYGIEFIEIKRKTIENDEENVISASNVRKFMKTGQWDMVKQVVPEATYNFLVNNYK